MPQANEWTPEDGDNNWWPDPDRLVGSYTDTELRFLPVYRQARVLFPYEPTDAEILAWSRKMIVDYLEPDEAEPEQEKFLLRLLTSDD